MERTQILIVVDYQYDFVNPNGSLYVKNAEQLKDNILKIIPKFDCVIFTQDCHPIDHCSFKQNGGIWPLHCVKDSIGSGIPVEFFEKCNNNLINYFIIKKGTNANEEEYGAFNNKELFDNLMRATIKNEFWPDNYIDYIDEIVINGVAGDYCVIETIKNVINHINKDKVKIHLDGIVSIDEGEKLNKFIKENNIKTY